ncbi:Quinic acid utilization activator [Hyphodiscus hymeniophilus]|uniref:Quinic acid utilization activator n=1 Tax=Hyphodiscus hymeniophilus TaxID=353542 RepID=A0A9P6VF57_9HELO|nr:Quinic acid utilization activator [Hyphodiscus hymeniophilus]
MEYQEQSPGQERSTKTDEPDVKKSKGGPRKRVSQACDRCRSRKDKCDGKRPACTTCTTNGRDCSYDANVKKRGLPEGYVRGLEKLWGLAIRDVGDVEDDVLLVIAGETGTDSLTTWNDEVNSDNLVEIWRKSQISRELERLLSNIEPLTDNGKRKRGEADSQPGKKIGLSTGAPSAKSESQKPSSNNWPSRKLNVRGPDAAQDSPNFSAVVSESEKSAGREYESILSPYANIASTNSATITEVPDLPSEAWHLLDVYFSYTHSWLPILEKHDLLRTSYQYSQSRNNIPMFGHGSGDHAALWAAIAYAKFQHRTINNIPHAQGPVAEMVWTAERMYSHARSLIPNEEGIFELGHVQALLILALTNMGINQLTRAWFLIGQAVRAATSLGLGRPSDDIMKAFSKSRAKHVFLGCFVLDTIISARLEHRPHLRAQDVDLVGLIEEDGLEEWDPWKDCLAVRRGSVGSRGPAAVLSTFNKLVQVLQILNEATCITDNCKRLQHSTGLLEKLHIWSSAQPSPLYFDSSAMKGENAISLLPHQHNLHIAYLATLATSELNSHGQGLESVNLDACTKPARQIAELLREHSENFGLLIVPPTFEYFIKTAYDVVRAVNGSIESTHIQLNGWKHSLDNCLDSMEQAWPVFESFKTSPSYQMNPKPSMTNGRRQSEVAYDLISGTQTDATPVSGKTPNSMTTYDAMMLYGSHIYHPLPGNQSQPGHLSTPMGTSNVAKMASPVSARTTSFGQSSVQNLPLNLQTNSQAIFNERNPISTDPWSRSANLGPPFQPREGAEMDPAFNEFAALDAVEWTNNWDQSLVNLGFTDRDNMNQDFYAMSREPDPLFPNNVFQQLVANSNAEATYFLDSSMFGGIGMGGFEMGFGDENEGIEAGQILQALSAAADQRVARGNG